MNKLVKQLTRVADALEKNNDLTAELEERMRREDEAAERRRREEEERMEGLPKIGGRLLH